MATTWEFLDPRMTMDRLGSIPEFLDPSDPRPAKEQINDRYRHGGGWRPYKGFKMSEYCHLISNALPPLAKTVLREETIYYYQSSWVAIVQQDGSFEVALIEEVAMSQRQYLEYYWVPTKSWERLKGKDGTDLIFGNADIRFGASLAMMANPSVSDVRFVDWKPERRQRARPIMGPAFYQD